MTDPLHLYNAHCGAESIASLGSSPYLAVQNPCMCPIASKLHPPC